AVRPSWASMSASAMFPRPSAQVLRNRRRDRRPWNNHGFTSSPPRNELVEIQQHAAQANPGSGLAWIRRILHGHKLGNGLQILRPRGSLLVEIVPRALHLDPARPTRQADTKRMRQPVIEIRRWAFPQDARSQPPGRVEKHGVIKQIQ